MNQSSLFLKARWRLALLYAGVMGAILGVSGIGAYQMMAHAHWLAVDRELELLSGTLHDALETAMKQPGKLEPSVRNILPNLCVTGERCRRDRHRHILGVGQQESYYVRLLNNSGQVLAIVGQPPEIIPFHSKLVAWETIEAPQGERYHQHSLILKTSSGQFWGYMQIGRSLDEYDQHLDESKLLLFIGLPLALLLVSIASWYMAGVAMQPVYASYLQIQQFTGDAAHELRTPLAAIRATVDSSLRTDRLSDSEAREILQTIQRQSLRFSQLVQDLLLLSRMDLEAMPWKQQSCCLNDIVSDLMEELSALALSANIHLKLDIRTQQSLYVLGDEEQLYRLIANLITNDIQYTSSGGEVGILLDSREHNAEIHIKDTGMGIAEVDLPKIFDRFYRVSSDRSRITGGSGLGLAIAKAIAQTHQGTIQVKSELGKGSTFVVYLPLKPGRLIVATKS